MAARRFSLVANARRHVPNTALLLLALALAAPVAGQDRDCPDELLSKAEQTAGVVSDGALSATDCLRESLKSRSPVSGHAGSRLRGLMTSTLFEHGHRPDTRTFEVHVAAPGALCMRYLGRDGRYSGTQNFVVRRPGWIRVPFDTQHGRELSDLGGQGLSVQAETGPDCTKSNSLRLAPVRIPASGERTGETFTLIAQISVADHARLRVFPANQTDPPVVVQCHPIPAQGSAIRYNTTCPVPAAAFQNDARVVFDIRSASLSQEHVLLTPLPP